MLQDVLRRWEAGPREFRLRFEVEWKGRNLSAIEVLISGGTVPRPIGPSMQPSSTW
jgi:hypothetical protein